MMASVRPIRGVIFDLDGLLVDSEPTWFEVESAFLADLGHTWSREAASECMGKGTPNTLRVWHDTFGVAVDIERDTQRIIDRVIARAADIALKEGALPLLDAIAARGLPAAVASSSPNRLVEAVLLIKGLRDRFDVVVSGQEVPRGKPAPDIFLRAAELLRIAPRECMVLEDSLPGARAARDSGAFVVVVPSVDDPSIPALAHAVLGNLGEAVALLPPA